MQNFDQQKFNQFILDNGVVGFFESPVKFVSGRESHCYVNWRSLVADVYLTDALADFVISFANLNGLVVDTFYGTPDGATKLAVICQYKSAKTSPEYQRGSHALAMGRKFVKEHGESKDRFFVGAPTGKTLVIEDVTSTGGSLLQSVKSLLELKIEVCGALALTNRNQTMKEGGHVSEALKAIGVPYFAMSDGTELIPAMYKIKQPGENIKESLIQEYQDHGVVQLSFED